MLHRPTRSLALAALLACAAPAHADGANGNALPASLVGLAAADGVARVIEQLPGTGASAFGSSEPAPLSAWVPGGVQEQRGEYTRIRGVRLRSNLWLGSTKTNEGWEGGLVVRQGDTTMAFNHRGATFSYRF